MWSLPHADILRVISHMTGGTTWLVAAWLASSIWGVEENACLPSPQYCMFFYFLSLPQMSVRRFSVSVRALSSSGFYPNFRYLATAKNSLILTYCFFLWGAKYHKRIEEVIVQNRPELLRPYPSSFLLYAGSILIRV
ncbi:hypothetical protein F4819DRAFT_346825 [Hypoxylon fuscum]|nr:hypothetical protein F4819DRAFT_346825 [Hypoxylon fuscum]